MKSTLLFISSILLLFAVDQVFSLRFHLPSNAKKCFREEIHKNVLVKGDYSISDDPNQKVTIKVTDSKKHVFFNKDNAKGEGKFAFNSDEYDLFDVCFESHMEGGGRGADLEVYVDVRHGAEAKNYDEIAKAQKLKPLEVELKRLEDLSESIVNDFAYMRSREEAMRDTNESTHSRVLYFSVFSMLCLLGLATWQVLYLRRYFKAKKLIE
ncbi:hypothetical protein BOX15_Mlig008263g2 [Macrostomum lignano]|uniref:GOLD domain-containing protein n=2 Tax=Macrostomum lignano TaxID=282301 RepID=A0A1I8IK50_9PLAT|nr:hypothetical protein BOX15_Mlig008263g2 [Macrostomum lignano]